MIAFLVDQKLNEDIVDRLGAASCYRVRFLPRVRKAARMNLVMGRLRFDTMRLSESPIPCIRGWGGTGVAPLVGILNSNGSEGAMPQGPADPVIDEVPEVRHRISKRVGHDPARLVAYYMELQEQFSSRLVGATEIEEAGVPVAESPGQTAGHSEPTRSHR